MSSVHSAIEDYRFAILHLTQRTQREYMGKLAVFDAWCKREHISFDTIKQATIRKFVEYLRNKPHPRTGQPMQPSSVHGYMRVLKAFLSWCSREDAYEDIISDKLIKRIEMPKVPIKIIEVFTTEQIKALLAACEREYNDELRVRDKAIISVLIDTGIRASELVGLTLDCLFLDPYDAHLKVMGKGGKWREVALGRGSLVALRRYVTRYRHANREEQHVFLNRADQPLTVWGLDQLIERLGNWARIEGVRCSPHTFRHSYAVAFITATGDVYRLMRLLGHTDIKVTQIYVRAASNKAARTTGMSVLDNMEPGKRRS